MEYFINYRWPASACLLIAMLLSACRAQPQAGFPDCIAGDYDEEILSGGESRGYHLHIPPSIGPGSTVPLLLGFHGAGSTGLQFEMVTGFSALADSFGFIAVYPRGTGTPSNWDTLPNSTDVPFIRDLIDSLETRCPIDPARIYVTGHSRGGGMANRLGCELSDRIAAIGPVSGDYGYSETCSPSHPVPVVAFHGTADPAIPYNGFGLPGQTHYSYVHLGVPIPAWAASWADRNGCTGLAESVFESGPVSGLGWDQCPSGAAVVLYTIQGGDHGWPAAVDASRIIWQFFSGHPLVEP